MEMSATKDDTSIIHERLLYGITRMLTEERWMYPEVEQIMKNCKDIVSSKAGYERLQKALIEIISGDHYRRLPEDKSLLSKITLNSLLEGAGKRRGKIIAIEYFWPQLIRKLVHYSNIACGIGYLALGILSQNPLYATSFFCCLLNSMAFASSHILPKWAIHKRLRLRERVNVTIVASKNVNPPRKKFKIKTTTSPTKFKQILVRRGIIKADIDEILIVEDVNIQGRSFSSPIKDSLPLAYPALLNDEITEISITLEVLPFNEIRKHLFKMYRRSYLTDLETDYYKIYARHHILIENPWDEIPGNWAHKIEKVISLYNSKRDDSKDNSKRLSLKLLRCYFTDVITFYYLLIHENYTTALSDYVLLKIKLGKGIGKDLSKLFLTEDVDKLTAMLEALYPELQRPLRILNRIIPMARSFLKKFIYGSRLNKSIGVMRAIKCDIENNPDIQFTNIIKCFYLMQFIPYIDRDVIRFANRFFYGLDITDSEWLEQLHTWEIKDGEIYRKLQRIIHTKSQENRLKDKQRTAKLNEIICYIAHKYCVSKPLCQKCYVRKFCEYASGRRMITVDEILI